MGNPWEEGAGQLGYPDRDLKSSVPSEACSGPGAAAVESLPCCSPYSFLFLPYFTHPALLPWLPTLAQPSKHWSISPQPCPKAIATAGQTSAFGFPLGNHTSLLVQAPDPEGPLRMTFPAVSLLGIPVPWPRRGCCHPLFCACSSDLIHAQY